MLPDAEDDDRQALIDLIEWYRDEYHHADWCHTEMIEALHAGADLDPIQQIVDGWLE